MCELKAMIKRNIKLFFKDKGMFFTSLITPLILLVLYMTFLGKVYRDAFMSSLPQSFDIPEKLINGFVGGELFSSLLAVCCVTVSFCSNMLMVQDKVNGARNDLMVTPVKKSVLALSYYISTAVSTLIICMVTVVIEFIYLSQVGWYFTAADIVHLLLDVFLIVMFGTALSSIINVFLKTQGQISAVGTIVSSMYGFICGAYMPISNFNIGLQRLISFLPGTYGTSLLRNHAMGGVFRELEAIGLPDEAIHQIRDAVDCNIYFFDKSVSLSAMYAVLTVTVILLIAVYVLLNKVKKNGG